MKRFIVQLSLIALATFTTIAQPDLPRSASDIQLALDRLQVLGSVLYIAAHPDDENTALLAYLAKGRHIRTAYLSTTRGEGGQNLIGSEKGEELGVIRTHELLAARRIDGAEQFFTRAIDFGYSKNSDEALRVWNKDEVLSDMVWVIRSFKPDVIITRFAPTIGGHGHHTASAILAEEAFEAAADSTRFSDQLRFVRPWRARRLFFNLARFFGNQIDTTNAVRLDLGEYSPLLGMSFSEIAGASRSMHKSQGFGVPQRRGSSMNFFRLTRGDSAKYDLFDDIEFSWDRVRRSEHVATLLNEARGSFVPFDPAASIPKLLSAYNEMKSLPSSEWVEKKRTELKNVILACAGVWLEAIASEEMAAPGDTVRVTASAINRSFSPMIFSTVTFGKDSVRAGDTLRYNVPVSKDIVYTIPADGALSQSYWLVNAPGQGTYKVQNQLLVGQPQNPPALSARFVLVMGRDTLSYDIPVTHRRVDPVRGEIYRPFEVSPPVTVTPDQHVVLFKENATKNVRVRIRGGKKDVSGFVAISPVQGWKIQPDSIPFALNAKGEETDVAFSLTPDDGAENQSLTVVATVESLSYSRGMTTIEYEHIPPQTLYPSAHVRVVFPNVTTRRKNIGYIMGPGDEIPEILSQLGYNVDLIEEVGFEPASLARYDAIVAGVRAYNTRTDLRKNQDALMEYVRNGGTYVVQYTTLDPPESDNLGPYPFRISRERVSVEDAAVEFLDPQHALLSTPNSIDPKDFDGWVQERGLYFADSWDSLYQALFASNDPDEPARKGGLLYARHGKGVYIYAGFSFFRQLPAGVEGAIRLFVNMIEAR